MSSGSSDGGAELQVGRQQEDAETTFGYMKVRCGPLAKRAWQEEDARLGTVSSVPTDDDRYRYEAVFQDDEENKGMTEAEQLCSVVSERK